jgi:predicted CXXCH cytochrome family protein
MKVWFSILFFLVASLLLIAPCALCQDEVSGCVSCHAELDDGDSEAPTELFKNDIHNQASLGCVGCHGGDPASDDEDLAMSEASGFIGVPDATDIPKICSRCHSDPVLMKSFDPGMATDQYSKYVTSAHGIRNSAGDTKVAQCASCHRAHDIRKANDPKSSTYAFNLPGTCAACHANNVYMAGYDIATDQHTDYERSVHGIALFEKRDVGAPACNDCHGNHGAVPPEVGSIDKVCGLCHANNMTDFDQSTHHEYFDALEMPACETCHSNHYVDSPSTAMLDGETSVCAQCHDSDESPEGLETAEEMRNSIDSLNTSLTVVKKKLDEADKKGLYVTNALFTWREARQMEFAAKTAVHTFELSKVTGVTVEGLELAAQADIAADDLLSGYVFRRAGLAVSVFFLGLLALLLWLKARQIDARQQSL